MGKCTAPKCDCDWPICEAEKPAAPPPYTDEDVEGVAEILRMQTINATWGNKARAVLEHLTEQGWRKG